MRPLLILPSLARVVRSLLIGVAGPVLYHLARALRAGLR